MTPELIPGFANRIREHLKRRCHGDQETIRRIDELSVDAIYQEGPCAAIDRIAKASPEDRADIRAWKKYNDEATRLLGTKEVSAWVKNLQRAHDLSPRKRPVRPPRQQHLD